MVSIQEGFDGKSAEDIMKDIQKVAADVKTNAKQKIYNTVNEKAERAEQAGQHAPVIIENNISQEGVST